MVNQQVKKEKNPIMLQFSLPVINKLHNNKKQKMHSFKFCTQENMIIREQKSPFKLFKVPHNPNAVPPSFNCITQTHGN